MDIDSLDSSSYGSYIDTSSVSMYGGDVWCQFDIQEDVNGPSILDLSTVFKNSGLSTYRKMQILLNSNMVFESDIYGTSGNLYAILPSIRKGDVLKIMFLGGEPKEEVKIISVKINIPEDALWYEMLLSKSLNFSCEEMISNVSPAFLEWTQDGIYGEELSSDYSPEDSIQIFKLPNSKRFADIPLNPDAETNVATLKNKAMANVDDAASIIVKNIL